MRPRQERGIAEQRDAAEHDLRRDEIEDRLEERPRIVLENLRHLRRHQIARLRLAQAMTSGRISGGGIEVPWLLPLASVQKSASCSGVVGRYQTML